MPKLGETVTEGTVGNWLKQVGDDRRVRRPAVRGVHRQGRLGDPQPVRRRDRWRSSCRRARRCRSARRWCGSASPGPPPVRERPAPSDRAPVAAAGGSDAGDPAHRMGGSEGGRAEVPGRGLARRPARCTTSPCPSSARPSPRARSATGSSRSATRRVRRPAVRGVHRQGRLGDPQPVRRRAAGDPGAGGGDGAGRHPARPHRRARGHGGRRRRAPAPAAAPPRRRPRPRRRRRRRRPLRRPTAAARCSRRSCAGWPPRTTWTWRGSRAPVRAGGSAARTSRRPSRAAAPRRPRPAPAAAPAAAAPATTQPRPAAPARGRGGTEGRRRPARRGRSRCRGCGWRVAGGLKALADARGQRVDLRRGRLRQRRQGAGQAQGPVQEGDRRLAVATCPSSRGRWSTRCARSRRSTPRSTSRPRP